MPAAPTPPVVPRMAAAVVALRDGADGLEVLVGQRTHRARFMGGFWVFPGGRVEPTDGPGPAGWRVAAAREAAEEAGLTVDPDALVPFDRWVTPEALPMRFDTAFFLVRVAPEVAVRVDGEEIVDSRWATPRALLDDAADGRAVLAFPTLRQLEALEAWPTVDAALAVCAGRVPEPVTPVLDATGDEPVLTIPGADGRPRRYRSGDVPAGESTTDAARPGT
ncbi:NUDIX hydrolase, partial [Patulibacter sp. S7RM1-6]